MEASSMIGHRPSRRKRRSFVWLILGQVWYLCAFDLVFLLASSFLMLASSGESAADASGGGSSTMDVRRSPKQTIHVSAIPYDGIEVCMRCVTGSKHEFCEFKIEVEGERED